MSIVDSSCSKTLAFQPPTNLNAIRSTLLKRIHQKKQENTLAPQTSSPASPRSNPSTSSFSSPLLSPATKTPSLLDHGLPSPPVEYQKKQQVDTMDIDMDTHRDEVYDDEDDAVSTISSLPPTNNTASASLAALDASSSSLSSTTTTPLLSESWNAHQLELKIKQLKEEKHQLFTQMKNLLQQQEKPAIVQSPRPAPLKTNCTLSDHQKETNEKPTQQEPSLPSPSPSPTSTPKSMNLQAKQKTFLKSTSPSSSSLSSPRSSSYHNNSHPHAFHYQQQQYRRRRSSLTSNNCLSAAAAMMTTPRYSPHSNTLSFGTASTNNNNNNINSNSMISPNSSSMTMDNNGRYRYSPYGVYFTPISSSPSGYNVRRPSYLPSRSTSSLAPTTATTIPVSSPSPNTFRSSRPLVNRHNPRY